MSNEYPNHVSAQEPQANEQVQAEQPALTMAEATKFLEFSPDALLIVSAPGSIVLANRQAARLFGYSQADLIGQPLERLLPERLHTAHIAHRHSYVNAPRMRPMGVGLDLLGQRQDGSEFPVDVSLRPVQIEQALHIVAAIRDITTQRLLEQERALQATLIDLAHDAILVCDPINRIRSWNKGAEDLYGWSEQEALGRVSHSLLQTRFPGNQAAVETILEKTGRWEGEVVQTCRDGHFVTVESRQLLLRNENGARAAILEMNRDASRRQKLEQGHAPMQALVLQASTFLHQVLDALPSGVCVVHGPEARLVLANQEASRVWGAVWRDDLPMRDFLDTYQIRLSDQAGRALAPEHWAALRALHSGETVVQQQEVIHQPSGASLPILVNAVPLVSAYWQSLSEIPSSPSAERGQACEPLALVIYQDVRLLKAAESFKEEFISITAHELCQPLAALKGAVGTLLLQSARGHGTPLANWQQEILQDLDQATDRLTDLTDDLLDVSRLQAGRLALQRAPTDLVQLARRVAERFQKAVTQHQVIFATTENRLIVPIDPRRIEQVLTNLLTNAIKYSPQGGPIRIVLERDGTSPVAQLRVQDHGMGIPAHQQFLIFGRFMRADNAQTAGIRGAGLGLYLCRALVEQHGGQLWFDSTEGVGSTFTATFPFEPRTQCGPLD